MGINFFKFKIAMGWYSCNHVGVVSLLVFLLAVINGGSAYMADNEGMMCYKPPPPATSDHRPLFEFDVTITTPKSSISPLPIRADVISKNLTIVEQCGISCVIAVFTSISTTQLNLDCKYNKPRLTRTPKVHSVKTFHIANGTTIVMGTVDFKDIAASDVDLNGTCQVTLAPHSGIISGLPNITIHFYLKLLGCPHGLYGIDCVKQSTCSEGVECSPFTGDCICPKGLQGKGCYSANPMVFTEATTVFVPFGDSVNLTCVAHGMYNPILMQWEKGGSPLATVIIPEVVSYSPSPIRMITKVEASTAAVDGVYTCKVNYTTELVYKRDIYLIVTDIPQPFLEAPVNQTIVLKQGATFRCQTKPEAGTLTWMAGDHTLLSNATSTGLYIVERDPSDVSLVFDEVRFEDAGMYRCIVGHSGANDSAISDAWLTVQSRGKKPLLTALGRSGLPEDTLRLSEDEEVIIVCEVNEAYPEPVISWLIGNKPRTTNTKVFSNYSDDGVSFSVSSLLTLKPTWADNGKALVCLSKVPDFKEDQSRVIGLDISYAPRVTISPKGETFQPGTSPMFNCSAHAHPSTNVTYQWQLAEQNNSVVKNFNGHSVQIHDLQPHHNKASLTCIVANDIGKNIDRAVIRVFGTTPNAIKLHYTVMILALTVVVVLIAAIPVMIFKHRTKIHKLFFNRRKLADNKLHIHDIFVAYKGGGEEEDFIRLSLIPKLEEWGCDVCVHFKNFKPGAEITENIQTAVSTSRKTILILSPDFMASEWCYYEFLCAMDEMLRDQTDIIPLMYQDIQHLELCDSMRHLLQTVSYVPWVGGGGAQGQGQAERFWKPLKRAVETHLNVHRGGGADDGEDRNDGDDVSNNDEIELIP